VQPLAEDVEKCCGGVLVEDDDAGAGDVWVEDDVPVTFALYY